MKKFLVFLLFIIILGGVGFFFGWAQLGVPPDAYGIIRSKTHGIDARLVKPGEFRWVWYKLIPTNAQTIIFRPTTVSRSLNARNALPSGAVYAAFAGITSDFSWEINAAFFFRLKPEAIVPLVTAYNISTQKELDQYADDIAGQIDNYLQRRMNSSEEFAARIEDLLASGESPELEREIQLQFPDITGFTFVVKSAKVPDYSLYSQLKGLYEEFIARQKDYISADLGERAKDRASFHGRFSELEMYGELLTQYPILLEYLKLHNRE